MKEKRKKAPATPESAAGKPVAAKTMPGSGAQNPRADGVRITAEMLAASAPVAIAATVVQQMHRHARSQMGAEVCGVLIGEEAGGTTVIEAAIAGEGAAQGGAHVTFTQDTWEHIYSVKDRDYPEKRIVGWYHSHPGFGIFLSQQDLFIHENFFSSPAQVAWVYDPHSDEEGCFGWVDGKVKRLREVRVIEAGADDAPVVGEEPDEVPETESGAAPAKHGAGEAEAPKRKPAMARRLLLLFALGVVFVAGFAGGVLLFPRTIVLYSAEDGRLLSPQEARAVMERELERRRQATPREAQPQAPQRNP